MIKQSNKETRIEAFILTWKASKTIREVANALKMSRQAVGAMKKRLQARGINLPKLKRSDVIDYDRLKKLAQE